MLAYYCRHFQTVEINATYYAIPDHKTFERMVLKTPPDFEFIVKTDRETTHDRNDKGNALQKLLQALTPMIESGKIKGLS